MRKIAGPSLFCAICFISVALAANGQSVPAETGSPLYQGFSIPTISGTLNYAINVGGRQIFGYTKQQNNVTDGTVSGNFGFLSPSVRMPTSITYTGGYVATTGTYPSAFFHDFSISQTYATRKFRATVSDMVRYLPDTPASGISGVVGAGTTVGTISSQGVLIPFATRIQNSSSGNASYMLTGKTSLDGTAGFTLERFPGYTGGIQTNVLNINGGVLHRITPLESWGARYDYSQFSYVYVTGTFASQGGILSYKRQLNRRLNVTLAGGPEYISSSTLTKRPSTLSYNADMLVSYVGSLQHGLTFTGGYKRTTNGGTGLTFGAQSDTFSGTASMRITRSLAVSAVGTYARSTGLQLVTNNQINSQSTIGSVQANRAFTRTLSAYVSYTVLHQAIQGLYTNGPSPLIGLQQVLGFGATYSPRSVHLGR